MKNRWWLAAPLLLIVIILVGVFYPKFQAHQVLDTNVSNMLKTLQINLRSMSQNIEQRLHPVRQGLNSAVTELRSIGEIYTPIPAEDSRTYDIIQEIRRVDEERRLRIRNLELRVAKLANNAVDLQQRLTSIDRRLANGIREINAHTTETLRLAQAKAILSVRDIIAFVGITASILLMIIAWQKDQRREQALQQGLQGNEV